MARKRDRENEERKGEKKNRSLYMYGRRFELETSEKRNEGEKDRKDDVILKMHRVARREKWTNEDCVAMKEKEKIKRLIQCWPPNSLATPCCAMPLPDDAP